MKLEQVFGLVGIGVKAAGAAALAAFHLTWPALIASLLGATFSFHFDKDHRPKSKLDVCYAIGAMAFAGLVGQSILPHLPGFAWSADTDDWARAAGVSLFANLIWAAVQRWKAARTPEGS